MDQSDDDTRQLSAEPHKARPKVKSDADVLSQRGRIPRWPSFLSLLPNTERLGRFERRQDPGQTRRQHRLARAWRADHQQIVAARGGDLQRAL